MKNAAKAQLSRHKAGSQRVVSSNGGNLESNNIAMWQAERAFFPCYHGKPRRG